MDPAYEKKKIIDLSDAELIALGFAGENALQEVKDYVQSVRANPKYLGWVNCFMLDCVRSAATRKIDSLDDTKLSGPPDLPPISHDPYFYAVVAPALISKYEAKFYYNGISSDPPELLWRSDIETNPFPAPLPGSNSFQVPTKTAHGVFNKPLNAVWETVAPKILQSIKDHDLRFSAINTVRFSIEDDEGETFGPVVVWIAVRSNTTAVAARDATPDILSILADAGITDVAIEWYEAEVTRL
ncbi:hypothetical protein BDW22DRAFT_1370552 [Trametopsis cervina]|nr:hypothetical protein BDW22DRAFT_1370552 [Trametopsis cervina]